MKSTPYIKKVFASTELLWYKSPAMRRHALLDPKIEQVNIRLTDTESEKLDEIATKEDRTRPYLVALFMRLGLNQYQKHGSLKKLREQAKLEEKTNASGT